MASALPLAGGALATVVAATLTAGCHNEEYTNTVVSSDYATYDNDSGPTSTHKHGKARRRNWESDTETDKSSSG